jgi:hypothetical protein
VFTVGTSIASVATAWIGMLQFHIFCLLYLQLENLYLLPRILMFKFLNWIALKGEQWLLVK